MKLAEALILRSDHQKRTEQLKQRLLRSAKVQEGEQPPEDPADLLRQLEQVTGDLTGLIQRINKTNSAIPFDGHETMAGALAVRDVLGTRRNIYRDLAQAGIVSQDRYSRSEVKFKSTVNVSEMQGKADELSKEYRELDALIQAANWNTDLID